MFRWAGYPKLRGKASEIVFEAHNNPTVRIHKDILLMLLLASADVVYNNILGIVLNRLALCKEIHGCIEVYVLQYMSISQQYSFAQA